MYHTPKKSGCPVRYVHSIGVLVKLVRVDILKLCNSRMGVGELRDNRTDWNLHTRSAFTATFGIQRITRTQIDEDYRRATKREILVFRTWQNWVSTEFVLGSHPAPSPPICHTSDPHYFAFAIIISTKSHDGDTLSSKLSSPSTSLLVVEEDWTGSSPIPSGLERVWVVGQERWNVAELHGGRRVMEDSVADHVARIIPPEVHSDESRRD
jgi:hypothetical protein